MTMLYFVKKKKAGLRIGISGGMPHCQNFGHLKNPTDPTSPVLEFPKLEISIAAVQTFKSFKVQHV